LGAPYAFARSISSQLAKQSQVLLWITEAGIWSAPENLLLYYKLRQSYGDFRLMQDAPGHLFHDFEAPDLTTFLQVAIMNGWGGYVLSHANEMSVFFSHDGFADCFAAEPKFLDWLRRTWS
jgi:hypothetical protein